MVAVVDGTRLADAFDRHGRSPLSFLVRYEAPWHAFAVEDGAVAYLEAPRAAVGWSDPLCPPAAFGDALGSFLEAMRRQRRSICLIAVSEAVARAAVGLGCSALKIGEEPWFDLTRWRQPRGDPGKKLRWALNHARKTGVTISEAGAGDDDAILDAVARWRAALRRPEPGAFLRTAPLEQRAHKRIFLARRGDAVEAVLACAGLPAADAWYLEDLVRVPGAVNGSTELAVVEALSVLQADGAAGAAFALAPMRGVDRQLDRRARRVGRLLSLTIRGFDRRYGFRKIARYEARFAPSEWRSRYVCFSPALPRPAAVRAAVRYLG